MDNRTETGRPANKAKELVFMGIMIALDIIAVRFLSITTPAMRIGLGFISSIIAGMYLGPVRATIVGVVADLLGFAVFPQGLFFPGFTLSQGVSGFLAGFFLEGKKSARLANVVTYAILSTLLVDTLLNTTWLVMMLHQSDFSFFLFRLVPRLPNQAVITILKIILVPIFYRTLFQRIKATGVERPGIRETADQRIL